MNPLDALHDIVEPDAIGLFPLSVGAWILVTFITMAIVFSIYWCAKQWHAARKRAHLMRVIEAKLSAPVENMSDLTVIAKRILRLTQPRHPALQLTEKAWCEFLVASMPAAEQDAFAKDIKVLIPYLYQPSASEHLDAYRTLLIQWWKANHTELVGGADA